MRIPPPDRHPPVTSPAYRSTMRISFVVPAYNEETYLPDCLDSILAQTRDLPAGSVEIIVVNNASTDRTREVALSYPGVQVVDEPRKGLTHARQAGFAASTGELIANVDSDSRLTPGWVDVYKRQVMEISQIEPMVPYIDCFQVGARNMQNFNLLRELGHARTPVLLKRGIAATIEEVLLSAEYILSGGNYDLMLCERGIRTYETYTRNTMDISAIPVLHKLTHLPVLADPSHGVGIRDLVPPLALASVAAGADGLLMEMHPNPDKAMSDGAQSLYPDQLTKLCLLYTSRCV